MPRCWSWGQTMVGGSEEDEGRSGDGGMVKHPGMNKALMEQGLGVVNKHWGGGRAGLCRGWLSPCTVPASPPSAMKIPPALLWQRDVLHAPALTQVPVLSVPCHKGRNAAEHSPGSC